MKILVTGAAGFIGFHLAYHLLKRGDEVIGIDNINDYYDINLKYGRLEELGINKKDIFYNKQIKSQKFTGFTFIKLDISDRIKVASFFKNTGIEYICNLAAQPGVRYSIENPYAYIESNINGFINILEGARHHGVKHLVYASSSSVYGLNEKYPFSTKDNVDHPVSLYAATKKSNELMAHAYSHLFNLPSTGLRFFTVYGPWGRPDMAYFLFTKAILEKRPIEVFNNGQMFRDFTYIDDIIKGILFIITSIPESNTKWSGLIPDPASSLAPYKIYNIGNSTPVDLLSFIDMIEKILNCKAEKIFLPHQPGDFRKSFADCSDLQKKMNVKTATPVQHGVEKFIEWYKLYYKV